MRLTGRRVLAITAAVLLLTLAVGSVAVSGWLLPLRVRRDLQGAALDRAAASLASHPPAVGEPGR